MTIRLRNLSIGKKLQAINLLVTSISSIFVALLLSLLLYFSLENSYVDKVDTLGALLSDNISPALLFNDDRAAQETLNTLRTVHDVAYAEVYNRTGKLFARYGNPQEATALPVEFDASSYPSGFHFGSYVFNRVVPIYSVANQTEQIGTVVLQMNLRPAYQQFWLEVGALLVLAFFSFMLLSKLLNLFQRSISQPLADLASVMHKVSREGDFSVRATPVNSDEIGELASTFNRMLEELSRRENLLQQELHERQRVEQQLTGSNIRFETVLKALPDLMFEFDIQGCYLNVWGGRDDLLFAPTHELMGRTVGEVLPAEAANIILASIVEADKNGYSHGQQISLALPHGVRCFELSTARQQSPGNSTPRFVVLSRDISERKHAEKEIEHLAFYDPLTRLPNRRLLLDRLQQALASSARSGNECALLFIDLDHFKTLNDTHGHDVGDLLLQQVALQLTSCVRSHDTVARLGGDEFVVILEDMGTDPIEAAARTKSVCEKIFHTLTQPYQLGAHEHHSTPSIGATVFGDHEQSHEDLLKQADIAMYQAKNDGRNTLRFFDPRMQESINERAALESELHHALKNRQFRLYYQIQVDSSHCAVGAETLIRWIHPERGLVSPAQFIPLAEETGLILPIGQWVMETACAQLKTWEQHALARDLILAVNVSAKQFRQADFVTQVQDALLRHSINPTLLKLELTESLLLEDVEGIIATMNTLKDTGVQFSLDDFGTGYSSLQYLKRLPLNQLKIDQSFVRDIVNDSSDKAIVRTVIAMAESLNLDVIAEGVETEEQRQLLLSRGCTHYQGYLFSKPVPIEQFEMLLKRA